MADKKSEQKVKDVRRQYLCSYKVLRVPLSLYKELELSKAQYEVIFSTFNTRVTSSFLGQLRTEAEASLLSVKSTAE